MKTLRQIASLIWDLTVYVYVSAIKADYENEFQGLGTVLVCAPLLAGLAMMVGGWTDYAYDPYGNWVWAVTTSWSALAMAIVGLLPGSLALCIWGGALYRMGRFVVCWLWQMIRGAKQDA